MDGLLRLAMAVSRIGAIAGGALLLGAALIIGIDVVLRYSFNLTIGGADELSGYALAIASAWGFSHALLHRSHIRVDSFHEQLPSRIRAILDLLAMAGLLGFMALVTWWGWGVLTQSIASNARSISALSTPLAVPQALWVAGLMFLLVIAGVLLIAGGAAYVRGDLARVARLIGPKAAQEEVDEEVLAINEAELKRR